MSDSVVLIGEVLYTVDNNQSEFVQTEESPEGDPAAHGKSETYSA